MEWVELVSPNPLGWAIRFKALEEKLRILLPAASVEHIGSTSVPDLPAKDVIDVLVGVEEDEWSDALGILVGNDFDCEGHREGHAWLSFPDREDRKVVVHLVLIGGRQWKRRTAFRDILRRDAQARMQYLSIKREATHRTADWGTYTAHKASVVTQILDRAGYSD